MESLLINLIKDDLVHTRLLLGFMDLGFDPSDYQLNLNEAIFRIAGFKEEHITMELREWYFRKIEESKKLSVPPRSAKELGPLSRKIYRELIAELELRNITSN